jgi:hypothetical protein
VRGETSEPPPPRGRRVTTTYQEFLQKKTQLTDGDGITTDPPDYLFPFQASLTSFALARGRAAIFADCGLGKTPMQLAWADAVARHTDKPVLVLTPLAVSYQTVTEAEKFGLEAAVSRTGEPRSRITVTNYDRIHHFNPADYGGVVCDESSALKAYDGQRRHEVTRFLAKHRFRLLCTATAAPNDYVELGTSSEALGELGYVDMLARFFTNNMRNSTAQRGFGKAAEWRFKGHAETPFWRWVSSWARAMRKPSDLGFDDTGFSLPELTVQEHVVAARETRAGVLFDLPAQGLREEREEERRTVTERCEAAAGLAEHNDPVVVWCHRNNEADLLTALIPGAVQVAGSDTPEDKEAKLLAFSRGDVRCLVTKPIIGAWGLNWQHCNRMVFFPSHSYEQYYQAVRRSWRFGQKHPVTVDIVTTEGGVNAMRNLERKAAQADRMFENLVAHMRDAAGIKTGVEYDQTMEVPNWL